MASCLESILTENFGCKHPFRSKPVKYNDEVGERFDYLTASGWKAYEKLVDTIYALEKMGVIEEGKANDIIEELDSIASNEQY